MARVSRPAEDQGRVAGSMTSAPAQVVFVAGDWPCSPKTGRSRRSSPRARNRSTEEVSPRGEISLITKRNSRKAPGEVEKAAHVFQGQSHPEIPRRQESGAQIPIFSQTFEAGRLKHQQTPGFEHAPLRPKDGRDR